MPEKQNIEVLIEKLVYGGDGLGRIEGRTAVLVPQVLPGERVAAEPVRREPRLVRVRLAGVLEPSPDRIPPGCPYFGACGGCHYQHMGYERQLREKAAILVETLRRVGKLEAPEPAPLPSQPWNYRNRTRFKFEKAPAGFRLGYFESGSHRLLAIERCPISSPRINALIPQLYELGKRPDFANGKGEIEVFVNHDDNELLLTVTTAARSPETLVSAAREIAPGLVSLAVRATAADQPRTFGRGHLLYQAAGVSFRVSHGSFFQTNRFLVDAIADAALANLEGGTAVDLFSGVGYFALPLARRFQRVVAVESNPAAARDLDSNRDRAGLLNIEVIQQSVEDFLASGGRREWRGAPASRRRPGHARQPSALRQPGPEVVVLDPPRAGFGLPGMERLASLGPHTVVYVSCDPATLARDLAALAVRGYRLESLKLADLFPQTFHIETIARLKRIA